MCSICGCIDKELKKELPEASISFNLSIQLKDITVRIVHAGGREELYRSAIPASQVMQRHRGMCIAKPDIFKSPHESVLSADDELLLGHKYYLIPSTTVRKLKRKHSQKQKVKLTQTEETTSDFKESVDVSEDFSDESICSAKDFYIPRSDRPRRSPKKSQKEKQPFVPHIQKPKAWKEHEWEPSLTSIKEVSP